MKKLSNNSKLNENELNGINGGTMRVFGFFEDEAGNVYQFNGDKKETIDTLDNFVSPVDSFNKYHKANALNRILNQKK